MSTTNQCDTTIVITSCGRPDDLRQTLSSIMEKDLSRVKRLIVIEDSQDERIAGLIKDCLGDFPYLFLQNETNMGQIYSVDRAYAEIDTPYIYHCEDDWIFPTSLFIEESTKILESSPFVHSVMLRDPEESPMALVRLLDKTLDGIPYWEVDPKSHRRWGSFSFNPGLRRLTDYKTLGPFKAIGPEAQISLHHKIRGFRLAHLKRGDVKHIGFVTTFKPDETARTKSRGYLWHSFKGRMAFLRFKYFG
ncbi:MAG: glycosyltransferase family A protein [Planktomarina sp.]